MAGDAYQGGFGLLTVVGEVRQHADDIGAAVHRYRAGSPVAERPLGVRREQGEQLFAARALAQHVDLLAGERLAVAVAEPPRDRLMVAPTDPGSGAQLRHPAPRAAAA